MSGDAVNKSRFTTISAVLFYACCSVNMVLTNKAIAMLPAWRQYDLLLVPVAIQNVSALVLLVLCDGRGRPGALVETCRKLWPGAIRAARCLPCSFAFVGMILTSFLALSGVSVPFVTVGKNATNVLTAIGEWQLMGSRPVWQKGVALALMLGGALAAGWNDLNFSLRHYMWLALNCVATSGYTLSMRVLSLGGKDLPSREATIAINNGVSLLLIVLAAGLRGELNRTAEHLEELLTPKAIVFHLVAGGCAFLLNFATMNCIAATSALTYAMVGAVNKLPTAVIGYLLWHTPMSKEGVISIGIGLFSAFIYALA